MTRDSFIFYRSFADGLKELSDPDRLACYDAIVAYALDGICEVEGVPAAVLALVKPIIDANRRKAEAGRKGGEAKGKQSEAKSKQSEADSSRAEANASTAKLNSKEEIVNSKEESKREMRRPTAEDVRAYADKAGLNIDADRFINYYESNGWKVGRASMKDWRAAARNWSKREKKPTAFDYSNQRQYTAEQYAEIERRARAR